MNRVSCITGRFSIIKSPGKPHITPMLLSHFSLVQLCVTPWMAAYQAPPPMGFSRQVYWSGLPLPSLILLLYIQLNRFNLTYDKSYLRLQSESKVTQSCPTLCDPMDGSLPGSSVHGIFQARVLEWGAISFSENTLHLRSNGTNSLLGT